MKEIGAVIGVCESRVSQLRSLAVSRLRASMRKALGIEAPEPGPRRATKSSLGANGHD